MIKPRIEESGVITQQGTTITAEVLNTLAYPVGSIYMSVNSTNPRELFGGTWVAFGQGRAVIGAGHGTGLTNRAAGATGGTETHTLTLEQMPRHDHGEAGASSGRVATTQDAHNVNSSGPFSFDNTVQNVGNRLAAGSAGTTTNRAIRFNLPVHTHASNGNGEAHNNMQPWIVVHMWRRTA